MRIRREQSLLLVVDVQARLAPAVAGRERAVSRIRILMQAAALLRIPMLVSEHYRRGLGATVPEVAELAPRESVMGKVHFSCADEDACLQRISATGRGQVVLAGMEAHVCVMQTALGLAERGYHPFVVQDATASRRESDHGLAMTRMGRAGIPVVSSEMVAFEWLHRGDVPEFRDVLVLIK